MCCCDCLLVAALERAARPRPEWTSGAVVIGARTIELLPVASTDQVPSRLCGWKMLPLLHRRWRQRCNSESVS